MKEVVKMKKEFIKLCEAKRKSKKAEIKDISKKMHIESENKLEKYFDLSIGINSGDTELFELLYDDPSVYGLYIAIFVKRIVS